MAVVSPQSWLFQTYYKKLRVKLLQDQTWQLLAKLGTGAFETISGEVVNVSLACISRVESVADHSFAGLDAESNGELSKAQLLCSEAIACVAQLEQIKNPDSKITLGSVSVMARLSKLASTYKGICSGDGDHFQRYLWEIPSVSEMPDWTFQQSSFDQTSCYAGKDGIFLWGNGCGEFHESVARRLGPNGMSAWIRGGPAWGKKGVVVRIMKHLPVSLYSGELYDNNVSVIIPNSAEDIPAVWSFCESSDFNTEVRRLNQKLSVTDESFVHVPFDLGHWQRVAAEKYPNGLPKPYSSDPTQWLFNGHPKGSEQPLHVALARLLGYRWPRQTGSSFPDCPALDPDGLEGFADTDGIVCLAPINREQPAAARLRHLLAAALGTYDERALLAAAGPKGSKSKILEDWLRDEAFEQHCAIFHDRPFIWHLWDGLKDGFHVLVNYHRLDHATLEKLTFSYLGEWIRQQADDAKADKPGAAARLGAAQALQDKLKAILTGEAPLDIFVRWKPLNAQPIGWNPDLNDGLRQNIRPFLLAGDVAKKGAGLFRAVPLKLKESDRGTEPERPRADYPWFWCEEDPGTDPSGGRNFVGTRWNTTHLTLATKRAARL